MLVVLGTKAQYISRVLEYTPAPGQHINSSPWGDEESAGSILGGIAGTLSLGAFGGQVVFAFENPVENDPDNPYGVDFSIFGNPLSDWSEPGVVWVMKDENENGEADDDWYQLAGSDYYFSGTLHNYRVRYTNPGGTEARDVSWEDHQGNQGIIKANSAHTQSYYPQSDIFPRVPRESYELSGTLIQGAVDVDHPPVNISLRRAFGYADNKLRGSQPYTLPDNPYTPEVEHSGGDAFDISWAVDSEGEQVVLDQIHFVKVQNGLLHQGGWLGELSTEITGAVDVSPDAGITGMLDLLVVRDIPSELDEASYQLEPILFHQGKPMLLPDITWTSSEPWAEVDENHRLSVEGTGALTLTATVASNPAIQTSLSTQVVEQVSTANADLFSHPGISLYPNPARESFRISGGGEAKLMLMDLSGKVVIKVNNLHREQEIPVQDLSPGIYMVRLEKQGSLFWFKLLKQ